MNPLLQVAMQTILNRPDLRNNQIAQQFLNIVNTGDVAQGQQLAQNLCQTYGLNPQDAAQQAQNGLRNMFHM